MITRIIYDTNGTILSQQQGSNLYSPVGIPYLDIEIPIGKHAVSIDVSVTPNVAVLEDLPKSELQALKEENTEIKLALAELAEMVVGGSSNG
ncbi:hypothetical protein EHE19_001640 [Ruminiclostridium herbifermentans]|uniref:Uncharacterized protein n=1 Tax=Ruminiclostridium herbifermentans TaxID=2488810 RepID=A0A4U7JBA6_9FIRM|nr:hypothetical protein [Ruminiclostridium herbifermentans]QNU67274.1 hypothetical protein EHE19_001640 [Ruminiclostridium herbifermentans]